MKILIVGSCTNKKKFKHSCQPTCDDLTSKEDITKFTKKFPEMSCKAIDMYKGNQHISLLKAINILNKFCYVDYYILSAGYGLLHQDDLISSYNCSFIDMTPDQIKKRANKLNISNDFQEIIKNNYDLIYLALGKDYLLALGEWEKEIECLTVVFQEIKNKNIMSLEANNEIVKKYSNFGYKINGVNGFKGDLLLIVANLIQSKSNPKELITNLVTKSDNLLAFIENEIENPKNRSISDFY